MLKYLLYINFFSLIIYGVDKFLAIKRLYRISEFTLLIIGFFGGCLGSLSGMIIFRHKIRKPKFYVLNIIFTIIWLCIIFKYYNKV